MKGNRMIAAVLAAAVLALAGCSGDSDDGNPLVGPPLTGVDTDPATPPGVVTPSTAPEVKKPVTEDLKLGQIVTVPARPDEPSFSVMALKFKTFSEYDNDYDAVEARFCLDKAAVEPVTVTSQFWSLVYAGGESLHDETTTSNLRPAYPDWASGRQAKPGTCVRGWITFTGISGKPEAVQYSNDYLTASWKLP